MSTFLRSLITFYQKAISPYVGHRCRYVPTCSEYMKEALSAYGAWKGMAHGIARLARCAPWGRSGLDPVNEK